MITPEQEEQIYELAVEKWGKALQLVMVLEETAELQKEVCKVIRGDWSEERMEKVAEEIADNQLMLNQLIRMTGTDGKIALIRTAKLIRLAKKLGLEFTLLSQDSGLKE